MAPMTVPTASGEKDADKDHRLNRNRQGSARRRGHLAEIRSAQVRAGLADLGVSVADYELLLIVSLEPCGVVL